MSELIKVLKRIDVLSFDEFKALDDFVKEHIAGYTLSKERARKGTIPFGEEQNVPLNPFSQYEFDREKSMNIFDHWLDKSTCGQYATKGQWIGAGRKVTGDPVETVKIYGKEVEYYSFEQTSE